MLNSKESLEHICKNCDNECCPYIHYEQSRCSFYGVIRKDLDRLEKLEKENKELKERYKHRAEISNDLCKAVKQYEKAFDIVAYKSVNILILKYCIAYCIYLLIKFFGLSPKITSSMSLTIDSLSSFFKESFS